MYLNVELSCLAPEIENQIYGSALCVYRYVMYCQNPLSLYATFSTKV
jgi:hypothetical protein